MKHAIMVAAIAALVAGCSDNSPSGGDESFFESDDEVREFDEDAARQAAERELALQGYDYSYGCTADCSGHEAGWEWRAENGFSDPGNSDSFAEGGIAFDEALEQRVEEMRDEFEAGLEPEY